MTKLTSVEICAVLGANHWAWSRQVSNTWHSLNMISTAARHCDLTARNGT